MQYSDYSGGIFSDVAALYKRGIKAGTGTTRKILDRLSFPERKFEVIHVAGTNGKGSVCEYLTQILICAGKKVGTYTSPCAYDYGEQFRIDGVPIAPDELAESFEAAYAAADGLEATGFEVETAGAFLAFARAGCDVAVIECGMGGRDDATNAIEEKRVAVITSIGLEHTAYLGNSLAEICGHKLGIIKNCPAVISALQPDEVKAYMGGNCGDKGIIFADKPVKILESGLFSQSYLYGRDKFELSMAGSAQPYNAACAIEAARLLKIDETAIYSGVKRAKLPARLQCIKAGGNTYVLDGAHNPACFVPLSGFIKDNFGVADVAIFGSLADKDIEKNVLAIAGVTQKIIAITPHGPRALAAERVISACKKAGISAEYAESVESALERACGNVLICGTFTILREAKLWIEKRL